MCIYFPLGWYRGFALRNKSSKVSHTSLSSIVLTSTQSIDTANYVFRLLEREGERGGEGERELCIN